MLPVLDALASGGELSPTALRGVTLGLPPTAIVFNSGVLAFLHLAKIAVTDSLNVVNSEWPKMTALIESGELRMSWAQWLPFSILHYQFSIRSTPLVRPS